MWIIATLLAGWAVWLTYRNAELIHKQRQLRRDLAKLRLAADEEGKGQWLRRTAQRLPNLRKEIR